MESEAKYTLIGAAVVLVTILAVVAILWLSDVGVGEVSDYYTVYFKEQSLEGLQKNSDVTMKGIKVGTVDNLSMAPNDIERVRVYLRLDEDTPVKVDTHAVLKRNLLTGLAFIDLVGSSRESARLVAVAAGESYPIIPEGSSKIDEIAKTLPSLLGEISQAAQDFRGVFSEENKQRLSNILTNVEKVTTSLGKNDVNFTELASDIGKASNSLDRALKNADRNVSQVSEQLTTTLDRIAHAAEAIELESKELSSSISVAARVITQEVSRFVRDFNRTAQTFSATVERYENPKSLLFGHSAETLGPGESTK